MFFFTKIRIKNSIIYGFTFILVLCVSLPFILNWAVNTAYIKDKISISISKKTNGKFSASRFSIKLFPKPGINVENCIFHTSHGANLNIKTIKLSLDIIKLLSGKIDVTHISVMQPEINGSKIIWPGIKTNTFKEKQPGMPGTSLISQQRSKLIHGIKKLFTLLPEHQDSIEFEFNDVRSSWFKSMDGSYNLSKEKNQLIVNASIKDIIFNSSMIPLDIEFNQYFDVASIKVDQFDCLIKADSQGIIIGEFKLSGLVIANSSQILFDSKNIDSSFKITENIVQIDIKPFKLNYPESIIEISFKDNGDLKKTDLLFTGTKVNINQARQMSLLMFKNNSVTDLLFEIIHKGIAPSIMVSFHGKNLEDLFNKNNFNLNGNIKNGLVKIPETDLMASSVNGNASIKNGVLDIKATKGVIQGSTVKKASLSIDLFNYMDFPFQGEFELDIDLSKIPKILMALLPDSLLSRELTMVHDVTGRALAKLNLSMVELSHDLKVKVHTDDFSIKGLYDRIPGNIDLKNINFNYDPDMVHLKKINGIVSSTTIDDLEIFLDFKDKTMIKVISGSGTLDLDSMMPWLMSFKKINSFISPVKKAGGTINITSIQLAGPISEPDRWKYDLKGRGTGINITTHLNKKEIENLSCAYHLSNDFIILNDILLTMNDLSWLEPLIAPKYNNTLFLPFEMAKGRLQIKPRHSLFNGKLKFNTGADIDIELIGDNLDSLMLNSINLHDNNLSQASIVVNYSKKKPLFDFNGYLNTTTLNKLIQPNSYWGKTLTTLTQNQPILISIDQDSNINITSKTINLGSIGPGIAKLPADYHGPGMLFNKTINFKTDTLKLNNLTFTNVENKISFNKDGPDIKINQAFLCNLQTKGHMKFQNKKMHMDLAFKAVDQPDIQNLLLCLLQKENFMTGNYSLSCNMTSDSLKKEILQNINGPLEFTATKGRINEFSLLSKIFSILNVSKLFKGRLPDLRQEGFAYKKIIIKADIKESIIYLSKAIIDGEDMTLIFNGWIDPLNDKLNLTCLVAPFKTIDIIIEKIPMINTMLQGRLVSIPVKASGKLSNPVVVPLHPSAVGRGLVNMMGDILKTPVKLLENLDKTHGK